MLTYILRRLALGLSVILATLVSTFVLFFAGPADPAQAMCPELKCPDERLAAIRKNLGLDQPLPLQFLDYFTGLFTGKDIEFAGDVIRCDAPCLGFSYRTGQPVGDELFDRFPNTIVLTFMAVVIFLLIGVSIGIFTAVRRGTAADRGLIGFSQVFGAIPYYVLALLFALYLVVLNPIFPKATTMDSGLPRYFAGMIAPALILGVVTATSYARYTRNSMIEVLSMDYVRTARSKGIGERRVLVRHGLRAAMSPIVTILGLDVAALLSGTLITEKIFEVQGIGRRAIDALEQQDMPVIMGSVLITAVVVVTMNLLVDIAYSYIDPRVRLS